MPARGSRPVGREVHHALLVHAEESVQSASGEHGQMGERAIGSVPMRISPERIW